MLSSSITRLLCWVQAEKYMHVILKPLKTESPFTKAFLNFHAFVVPSNLQYLELNLSSTVCWPTVSSLWKLLANVWEMVFRKIPLIRRAFEQQTVEPLSGNSSLSLRNGTARRMFLNCGLWANVGTTINQRCPSYFALLEYTLKSQYYMLWKTSKY